MVGADAVLCRRAEDIGPDYATVEKFVAFVCLAPVQVMLWRLKTQRELEVYLGPKAPPLDVAMDMMCQHALLILGVESLLFSSHRWNDEIEVIGIHTRFECLD
jgi:hypothetical protein